jgi:CHAT domain
MAVHEIEVTISPSGEVSTRADDGAYGPAGQGTFDGVDAELMRVFGRFLTERGREWRHSEIKAFGSLLHRSLFPQPVWSWIEGRYDQLGRGDRLRLQLAFPSEGLAHLAAVPWEYLHVPDRAGRDGFFVATNPRCILTRYIPQEQGRSGLASEPEARVLVLVSQPRDLGEVVADPVLEQLSSLTQELPLELTVRQQPTRSSLLEDIQGVRPHVVHFMGHGEFDADSQQGRIALVDEEGRADWVGEAVLVALLQQAGEVPRLVLLHSCAGAATDYSASFAGFAPRLIRGGVQCVVAMQYAVTNRTAIEFSKGFYRSIAKRLPVDEAVQAGRWQLNNLFEDDYRLLGIPVVYLYSRDAVLLPPREQPAPPEGV